MRIFRRFVVTNGGLSKCLLLPKRLMNAMAKVEPTQKAALSENCILVDEFDKELGAASKEKCHLVNKDGSLMLHRAFSVFLFNDDDKLLLQQRSAIKVTYPEYLTNTCCSHPLYDAEEERNGLEGVKLAAQRRLNFELGIPVDQCSPESLKFLTRLHYMSRGDGIWGEHEIDYVFILHKNVTLNPNPHEVKRVIYASPSELKELELSNKYLLTPWFQLISDNWLSMWWNNLHQLDIYTDNKIHKFNT